MQRSHFMATKSFCFASRLICCCTIAQVADGLCGCLVYYVRPCDLASGYAYLHRCPGASDLPPRGRGGGVA
ncbi:hypothetical protein C8F04DRAFT_743902 [Mycena alexandri]|uniref:Secreted protein n=1 Tax=Mycena alexandri TaxID=1745969 RepID=A0AAD6WYD2_9AGAR|nr:hypothetical protein C8F04DRAFT_743902 [Mycena alexandri]